MGLAPSRLGRAIVYDDHGLWKGSTQDVDDTDEDAVTESMSVSPECDFFRGRAARRPPALVFIQKRPAEKRAASPAASSESHHKTRAATTAAAARSTKLPIQRPPKEDEEMSNLQRLYDRRTWDMYVRITEARKRQRYATASNVPMPTPAALAPSLSAEGSDEIMIFGDMDDP